MSCELYTSRGYWRFVQLDRSKKYQASDWCRTIEEFIITEFVGPHWTPLRFEFVNGAWQAMFDHPDKVICFYNDIIQFQNNIIMNDGDSFRVTYFNTLRSSLEDVTFYYKEGTHYWSVEEAIKIQEEKWKAEVDSLQRQNQETAVQLESPNKSIDQCKELEVELRKQIADFQLQQHLQEERGQLANSMKKLQQVAAKLETANNANLKEIRKHNLVEAELRKQIADLQLQQHTQEERGQLHLANKLQEVADALESNKKTNLEEFRKHKEVETELREKITDFQGALQLQQEVKERGEKQQLPHSRTNDVIPQPSLQFPTILEQFKHNSNKCIEEMASIWERKRSQFNDKIIKLTRQLKNKQDREFLRKQAMAAVAMLNQSLQQDQELEGCEDTDDKSTVLTEEHWPYAKESNVSESAISILD